MRTPTILAAAVLTLTAATCSDDPLGPRGELAEARAQWARHGPADYDYTINQVCFCAFVGTADVEVRDGEVVRVVDVETGNELTPEWFPTIEQLFDRIQSLIDLGADRYEVTFDSTLGYPRVAIVDVFNIADEEMNTRIERLEAR